MKRFKAIISILLVILTASLCFIVPANAAEVSKNAAGAGKYIYFDASGWKNFNQIYAHIWIRGGASFFDWQAKRAQCERDSGNIWKYDLSKLDASTDVEGGLKEGVDYCVIFSANTGVQTNDITFGLPCIGDTAKITGKQIENAVNSEKQAYECVWTKNSSSYGPHLTLTSVGNVVGKFLCPNESSIEVIGDWLPTYYRYLKSRVDIADVLANAFPKFGIKNEKQVEEIYSYIQSKETGEDEAAMKKILGEALIKAYPEEAESVATKATKALYIGDKFTAKISGVAASKTTFTTSKKSVATVSKSGVITAKGSGSAKITAKYKNKTVYFPVKVKKPSITIAKKLALPVYAKYTIGYTTMPNKGGKVSWSSSNKAVAKVNRAGKVVVLSEGKAIITATLSYKGKAYKSKCVLNTKLITSIKELIEYIYN